MSNQYDYHNCQSLFGYALGTHIRCNCTCQLCGCGGPGEENFNLWRQMTVEHLIGASQGGYRVLEAVVERFPDWSGEQQKRLAADINEANMVTACSFCNSTTSRHQSSKSLDVILREADGTPEQVLAHVKSELALVLQDKRDKVAQKVEAVREGFRKEIVLKPNHAPK